MSEYLHCSRADRDAPGLTCGYPLPCPWHTFIADVARNEVHIPPAEFKGLLPTQGGLRVAAKLFEITDALQPQKSETWEND